MSGGLELLGQREHPADLLVRGLAEGGPAGGDDAREGGRPEQGDREVPAGDPSQHVVDHAAQLVGSGRVRDAGDDTGDVGPALPDGQPVPQHLRESRWLLEEYRVSLFAQQLGTREKVSDQRIRKVMGSAL